MRIVLLGAAALLAAGAVPASAEAQRPSAGLTSTGADGRGAVRVHRGDGDWDSERDRRDRHAQSDVYYPYRNDRGDTLWRRESFDDWWHERPHRAYPAWVARNVDCERLWWSGGGWRC